MVCRRLVLLLLLMGQQQTKSSDPSESKEIAALSVPRLPPQLLRHRMTREELESYAKEGILPAWFEGAVGATGAYSRGDENEH
jgi:hypothetical protein